MVLIALILLLWLALQTSLVQNWLVGIATNKLSKDLKTTVKIDKVDFSLFNKMHLEGTLIKDQNKDTLLYAGALSLNITDWFFLKDSLTLHYLGLRDAHIHLSRQTAVWNYQFLADYFGGGASSGGGKAPRLALEKVELERVSFVQTDGWRGEDQEMSISKLYLEAKAFDLPGKRVHLKEITLLDPGFAIRNYEGNRPDSLRPKDSPAKIINDPNHLRWNAGDWAVTIDKVELKNGRFQSIIGNEPSEPGYFNENHIDFADIQGLFKNVQWIHDTIFADASLKTKERSGLTVTKLEAQLKFHPEAMEFHQLDLQTPHSRLHNFYAMRYASFDDMGDFISKVKLEGKFDQATLNSDDIAYFAPVMKNWKKTIEVNGRVSGTVDDLIAKNLEIRAGNNTYLKGDIKMTGLPDINTTFIDFEAENFRTTYEDASTLIPALKELSQPRLDKLEYVRFKGNFTGFINDFVTYGSMETRLGTVVSDLNMKLPAKGVPRYSGTLKTSSFDLGTFLDVAEIGRITFKGKVDGTGISGAALNAKLDGSIEQLEVNKYNYHNLTIKGTVAKKLFNGSFVSNDPNLDARLNGLINFKDAIPQFDFDADIAKADLKKINLAKSNIEFNGKFRFDFSGNNIDNFIGSARIYEASLFNEGKRIPFDSLLVESKVEDKNKVITVLSNEFDAALAGEFSIKDLPAAFQTFLNKYYPSYIKPSKNQLKNENFSFVVTTKNVEDYIHLLDLDISGFNYSTIAGRINNKENLLDVNAEIPQFNFRNIAIYDLSLKGSGNMDRIALQSSIGDVYINDSLHFPGTNITISSANDSSDVRIVTSANQTLNAANLSAKVITQRNGVSILFNESSFDINGKSWLIDKNGELILSKDLVSAEGLKIYNGQQEIRITSMPSEIGNTNDIRIELQKLNIGDFAPYVVSTNRLEGLLTANIDIIDPFGKMQVDLQGDAEQFRLDDDSVGKISLNANYNKRNGKVNFSGISDNQDYKFDIQGIYNTLDSTTDQPLDIMANLNGTRIDLLERYLEGIFKDVTGIAKGQIRIVGPVDALKYLGTVDLTNGMLTVDYTNVTYKIPNATIRFKDDRIDFGSFVIADLVGNAGYVSKGILRHQSFDKMDFDFSLSSNKILVLNTGPERTDPFYGRVVAKTNFSLTGPVEDMVMNIKGQPADSSKFFIRSADGRESGQADFIVWKTYGTEMETSILSKSSKLTMNLDITANNLASMNVILDELTNDVMSAVGHGNLKLKASTTGELEMTGQFDIDKGLYNFNFQSLLRKPFNLPGDAGSYIRWSGNPLDAELKVTAEYEADNVKFNDLGLDASNLKSGGSVGASLNDDVKKYRGKVLVSALIKGKLTQPNISFNIDLPQGSNLRNDPTAMAILSRIKSDENELNKQVAFLIIFNSFGPMSTSSQSSVGSLAMEGIVVNSISGALSNALNKQFSNIVQKLFKDESLKVNFNAQLYNGSYLLNNGNSGGFNIDRTNVNFSLSRSLFNERLTFTFGSAFDFGFTPAQAQASNNLQFLPDIAAEWKLRPDGKLLLTFFYRDTYNYQSATGKQNRSGASISYRRDFEKFSDLWRNDRKKKKPQDQVPVADSTITRAGG